MTSYEAYKYCRDVEDTKEIRKFITKSHDAYFYCVNVKDRKSMRKFITDSKDAFWYCKDVKDRKSIRKLITNDDFEISKCNIKFSNKEYNNYSNTLPIIHAKLLTTDIFDYIDEKGLTLIPCSWEKENIKNSISRVIHWINKGCNISNETYYSMCNIVFDTNNNNKFNGS